MEKINTQLLCDILSLFENRIHLVGNDILKISAKMINKTKDDTLLEVLKFSMFTHHNFMTIRDFFIKDQWQHIKSLSQRIFEQQINSTFEIFKKILQQKYDDIVTFNFKEIMPFSETFLIWILNTFDISSNIVTLCFDYILLLRVVINVFGNLNEGNPTGFTSKNVNYVKELFLAYVSCNVYFKKEHLDIIQICSDDEILRSFFDHFIFFLFDEHTEPMIILLENFQINHDKLHSLDRRKPNMKLRKKWKKTLNSFICSKYSLCNIEFEAHNNFINNLNKFKSMLRE